MIFCSECFKDTQIKAIITGYGDLKEEHFKGTCPICGARNVVIYDTQKDTSLTDFFDELISIYTPGKLLPANFPKSEKHMLSDELKNEWNIFSDKINSRDIYNIIKSVSPHLYESSPELFDNTIGVAEKYEKESLKEYSILGGNTWDDFVYSIKHNNRFHTQMVNTEKLKMYLLNLRKYYSKGNVFFRGRLNNNETCFKLSEMGAPPIEFAKEGRANSAGISRLYLADSEKTCIHEIRAGAFDVISIGRFILKENITVVDLKQINKISPFSENCDFLDYLINKPILQQIDEGMGRAVRSSDNHLDYIPTQYLCDLIKTLDDDLGDKFAGVEYSSTLNKNGYNLAIFYPDKFRCTKVKTVSISCLKYEYY